MKLENHSRRLNRPATGYSSEEAEVPATTPDEYKEIQSLQSKATTTATSRKSSKRRHKSRGTDGDDDDYYQSARNFYAPSVVVETIYRRPQAFADLHQFDEETEIDNVPTAVGFHSMDSAEEVGMARSTGKRYEMDEIRPIVADPDPSIKSTNLSKVLRTLTAATTDTRNPAENEQGKEEDQVTIDDDIRYGHVRKENGFPAMDVILKATHSEDSESCPPIWKTESQEEPRDRNWMIAEAKRVRELNAVTVPKNILKEYETSQIIRHPFVEPITDKYNGSGAGTKWSRALRKLLGGSVFNDSVNNKNAYKNNYDDNALCESTAPPITSTKSMATSSVAYGGKDARSQVSRTSSKRSKAYSTSTSKKQIESSNASASLKDDERDDKDSEKESDGSSKGGSRQSKSSTRYRQVQSVSSKDNGTTKSSKDGKTTKSVASNKSHGTTTAKDPPTKLQEVVEERQEDRIVSSKATVQTESLFTIEESKQEDGESKSEYPSKGPSEATRTAIEDSNNDLIAASRSNDDNDDDDGESTNMDGDGTQQQEEISLQETATTQGGYGITDWVISRFDNLANIGFNKPMFGFLDWSGEEKMMEKLEAATTAKGATTAVRDNSNNGSDKKLPTKVNMTKRLLSKEDIKARLIEGHARRQQENQVGARNRERHENRDPDGAPALSSSSSPRKSSRNVTSPSSPRQRARPVIPSGSESIEVRTLTLDEGDKQQQTQSLSRTKKSLADSTQQQQLSQPQPVTNKEGLTIQFPTPGFAKSSKQILVTGGSKDEDDTSTSLLGLEKRKIEKPTKIPPPSLSDATKKFREQQQLQQSKNKKTLFGPFRLQNKKQQTKP